MNRKYYNYDAKQLGTGKIKVKCLKDSESVFSEIASIMINTIQKNNKLGKNTVFIIPVGPIGHYPIFIKLVKEKEISLKNCYFFNMDEYLDKNKEYIDKNNPLSFRGFMDKNVYSLIPSHLNIPETHRFFPDPRNPEKTEKMIKKLGGIDICFGGIGINGHLAFNEAENISAEEFSKKETRILKISSETKCTNAIEDLNGAIDEMPEFAVTIGMKQILESKMIVLGVFRPWHRAVIRRAVFDNMSGNFPVTLLQNHKNAQILSNNIAAERAF